MEYQGIWLNLNNFYIGKERDVILQSPLDGLTLPSIRTSSGDYSGRSGGWVDGQFYSKREIVIRGVLKGNYMNRLNEMQNKLPLNQMIPLFIHTRYGNYLTEVYTLDLKTEFDSWGFMRFEITLVAPEPYLYSAGDGVNPDSGWISFVIQKQIEGGYITPYILPVVWEAGTQPNIIDNEGVDTLPQIVLKGKWTNPVITNLTTNEFVKLNITTQAGDELIIDMKERTVTLNGGSVLPFRDASSDWWGLVHGQNTIEVLSDSQTDTSEAVIRYREQYLGIGANV